jgi:lipopolysaccharide/colanic/teichoic acid biosynthesis glycosyltransferase
MKAGNLDAEIAECQDDLVKSTSSLEPEFPFLKKRQERRHHVRAKLTWPVKIETDQGPLDAETKNVSFGGVCICCERPLRLNEILSMTIEAPNRRIGTLAPKLIWLNGHRSNGSTAHHEMAVCFKMLTDEDRQILYDVAHRGYLAAKRIFDFSFALISIILFFPVFLITALLIKLTSPGPVLFVQARLGKNKKRFNLYKFRTMVKDAEALLEKNPELMARYSKNFKIGNDPRITWLGKLLRKSSIDELPQLINILKGEMSFVGPRPIVEGELAKYREHGHKLLRVRPGLTGLWQAESRIRQTTYQGRIKLDMEYVDTLSFWKDARIVLKTIPAILSGNGSWVDI